MSDKKFLPVEQTEETTNAPELVWIRVRDAVKLLSPENPKLHDLGGIIQSLIRYGLQELPKYDGTVGWIKAGNGRVEALYEMERDGTYERPRGVRMEKETNAWVMPLIIGVDAEDFNQARSYLVDSNNLTMMGGDFTAVDTARLWDRGGYNKLLQSLAKEGVYTVSVDKESTQLLDNLLSSMMPDFQPVSEDEQGRLDQKKPVVCPECGHEFIPK